MLNFTTCNWWQCRYEVKRHREIWLKPIAIMQFESYKDLWWQTKREICLKLFVIVQFESNKDLWWHQSQNNGVRIIEWKSQKDRVNRWEWRGRLVDKCLWLAAILAAYPCAACQEFICGSWAVVCVHMTVFTQQYARNIFSLQGQKLM